MKARKYAVDFIGETPCLMHQDNIVWREFMKKWELDPENNKKSVAGDDRSPAWRWIGCMYIEGGIVVMPSDNIMTMMREGAKRCSTGKRGGTFKSQSQSGIVVNESSWPLLVHGKTVPYAPFEKLIGNEDFSQHMKVANDHGFTLFPKPAKIGMAKHIRVRPRFDNWAASGTLTVFDDAITTDVLRNILTHAGAYAGFGDWRPNSPRSPGPWGKFTINMKEV